MVGAINLHRGLAPPSCWSCRAHTGLASLPASGSSKPSRSGGATSYDPLNRASRPRVRSLRRSSWRLTCPLVRASSSSSPAGLTWPRLRSFEPGHRGPCPAGYPRRPAGGLVLTLVVSRHLSAAGLRFSAILFPPRSWALLAVGLPATDSTWPGPRRGYRVPHARATTGVGALFIPGRWCSSRPEAITGRRLPLPNGQSFHPRHLHIRRRGSLDEASTRVQAIQPSGLPLARRPRTERATAWAFLRLLTRRPGADDARRGGDRPSSTDLELHAQLTSVDLQSVVHSPDRTPFLSVDHE